MVREVVIGTTCAVALLLAGCTGELVSSEPADTVGTGDPEDLPESRLSGDIPAGSVVEVCRVQTGLNCRTGPSTDYTVVQTMPGGTQGTALTRDGRWYRLDILGKRCWSHGYYLCLVKSANDPPPTDPNPPSEPDAPGAPPSWGACSYEGRQGNCQETSVPCGGAYLAGLCPGPANVMCCFDEAPTPPADPPADPPPGGGGLGWQLPSPYQLDRDGIIATAAAFVGFSYWWGGAKLPDPWEAAGKPHGSCSSGVHSGTYGADCSGFVADVWQLPEAVSFESTAHPFSTASFYNDRTHWRATTREQARRGDAMVYRSGGSGHIVILESFDSWGQAWTYEARGCSYGIVHNLRSLSSSYQARVREGL